MELALALLALAAALPESGAPREESLTCSLFRDDIIGSPQSSRTTFFGRQAFAQVPVAIPAEHLYLLPPAALCTGPSLHQPGFSRPVYTRCFPSSPPISPPTHCFLTRSSPSKRLSLRPVASSCTISCCAQVLQAAHLHRRAAGIAHQPCWLKSKPLRIPPRPARGPQDTQRGPQDTQRGPPDTQRGPQDAQREDLRMPSARTPRRPARGPIPSQRALCHPSGFGQSHHPESCVGPWTYGHGHMPLGPSNCKSMEAPL